MSFEQCCEKLGMDSTQVDIDSIKKAYRKKAKEWHPDAHEKGGPEEVEQAKKNMQSINQAYTTISENYYEYTAKESMNVTQEKESDKEESKTQSTNYHYEDYDRRYSDSEQAKRDQKREEKNAFFNNFKFQQSESKATINSADENTTTEKQSQEDKTWRNQHIYANMVKEIYEQEIFSILLAYMHQIYKDLDKDMIINYYTAYMNALQNINTPLTEQRNVSRRA